MNGQNIQDWIKSLTPLVAFATLLVLIWLNLPTKADLQDAKQDLKDEMVEIKKDIRELRADYKEHLKYHVSMKR